ncbi:MAG: T9SS type A sorting domain-containing protein [Marinirhabdus sp.]|nr:T9SS type A sorting domain-containing protein [Marinirhabdus sp.]
MLRSLQLAFLLLFFSNLFCQNEELTDNQWFLEKIEIDGVEYVPPINDEVQNVPLFFETDAVGLNFWSFVCNALNGITTLNGEDSFAFSELNQTLGDCVDPENKPFELQYFQFYFANNIGEPYFYEITNNGTSEKRMTVTNVNGDNAYYNNTLLSVEENTFEVVSIFPNPTTNTLHIKTAMSLDRMAIYGVHGNLLISKNTPSNSTDVSSLAPGVYFVEFFSGETRIIQKFLKK